MKGGRVYVMASKRFIMLLDTLIGTIPKRLGF
jgi:hypothetical protein